MGRHSNELNSLLHSSSIALLQERFRQLQRIREMREKRELLSLFAAADYPSPAAPCDQPKWFFHPDLLYPSRPFRNNQHLQIHKHGAEGSEFQCMDTSLSMSLFHDDKKVSTCTTKKYIETDVDTSLHL